jgi:hypothetical protein
VGKLQDIKFNLNIEKISKDTKRIYFFIIQFLATDYMKTMCENFGIYNRVFRSLLEIKSEQQREAHEALKEADCIVGTGAGRIERTLDITSGEFARNSNITYINSNDPGFPGDTFDIAAPKIEKKHRKIVNIFASSSGETDYTNSRLEQFSSYVEKNQSDKWKTLLLTQNPNSTAGKLAKEIGATIVEMKGSENKDSKNYREYGMQRDEGEWSGLWCLQTLYQALIEGVNYERVPEIIENELPKIGKKIDEWEGSQICESLTESLGKHCNVFTGGERGSKEVSRFVIKRIDQVKGIVGDNGYCFGGDNTPDPREGDLAILPSQSGGKKDFYSKLSKGEPYILKLCKKLKTTGVTVYPFVGTEGSPLEELCGCEHTIVVDSPNKKYPSTYPRIMFFQGILPILLAERLDKKGYDISPQNLKKRHGF